jgi:anion-transporting  ArsA/GET3 family ATPase
MTAPLWHHRRVIVCVGTGGVGKTTVAAALALAAARAGRRVVVMTIDPSRRLAQALGLTETGRDLQPVTLDAGQGSLHALILDVQATFDAIITSRAPSKDSAERILKNRIYQHFSASMAGSHEYAAVEKLWDLSTDDRFDLVVLDTPPSQHALDFLDAPGRILRFLQGQNDAPDKPQSMAQKMSRSLFNLGGSLVTRTVGRISGAETLGEITAFLQLLREMYDSFKTRAQDVEALLAADETAFTLVGGPSAAQIGALEQFATELARFKIRPAAWVINRVHPSPIANKQQPELAQALRALRAAHPEAPWLGDIENAIDIQMGLAARDAEQLQALGQRLQGANLLTLSDVDEGASPRDRLMQLAGHFA